MENRTVPISTGTYYYLSSTAHIDEHAIGKVVDGKIYFIVENIFGENNMLTFVEILEKYINRKEEGFRPKAYRHSIYVESKEDITDEDLKCFKIAFDGIEEFSKLINKLINEYNKQFIGIHKR